ncbi:MAG: M15 family metallopeptidase [Treponema sp.]|nr:M15 family metallopeptidase [Treponema sp.]
MTDEPDFYPLLLSAHSNSQFPDYINADIKEKISNPSFITELFFILQEDPYLRILVDKNNSLASDYIPLDLVELKNASYRINRQGLLLRDAAQEGLEKMAASARLEGLTLLASSAYRSYDYQDQVYRRHVNNLGRQAADRVSARPGHSQHQLGLALDFGCITNAFAATNEGRWLAANASRFGWSLSYPEGYEEITGYSWECWHYRYVGTELAQFIDTYFAGIQQYALRFIHEWEKL